MRTLAECLAISKGNFPFTVRVVKAGGQFEKDWDLTINSVGFNSEKNQVTYNFTNETTGKDHRAWRHTSEATFALIDEDGNIEDLDSDKKSETKENDDVKFSFTAPSGFDRQKIKIAAMALIDLI